ncbi:NADPH-dependent FMN reductase [Pikeienuella piscinae]|nr:NAD(P)H-dependent oxidoreductase [Pikeienuella piscinae]
MAFRLLGVSGALRRASTNSALIRAAGALAGEDVDFSIADIDLPLYNGDVEDRGYPDKVVAFVETLRAADAVVISTPEYNKGVSGVLKNALDWQSRFSPVPLSGKPVAIMSATGGYAGGQVSQFMLRQCLTPFAAKVISQPQVHVGSNETPGLFVDGELADERVRASIAKLLKALREIA